MGDTPGTSWAETADDGYFSQPGTFMKSNYRDVLCCFVSNQSSTQECSSSDLFKGEQVGALQALEAQTHTSLDSMLRSVSEDIPLSQEDIRSIIGRTSEAFARPKSALASAIKEKTDSPMPRCPKPLSSSSSLPHLKCQPSSSSFPPLEKSAP
jgi:hypothetical protein